MKTNRQFGLFNLRVLITLGVFFGVAIALLARANQQESTGRQRGYSGGDRLPPTGSVQEEWVARYDNGSDEAQAIVIDHSGNVYVTGASGGDYSTVKYDSSGKEQWVASYNGPDNQDDNARAIAVDGQGNVYVTGASLTASGTHDYATIKYNSVGKEEWVVRYNGPADLFPDDNAVAIAIDTLGNVYVTGESAGDVGYDYATVKYDSSGDEQWVGRYHGPGGPNDYAKAVAVDSSGNVYVTGWSRGSGNARFDYATIRYNSVGEEQWVARYDGSMDEEDEANAIALDSAGNVYVTGRSFGPSEDDYATIKYNPAGEEQWVTRYDGGNNDRARAIAVDSSANVYVTGQSEQNGVATVKYDSAGKEQWVAIFDNRGALEDNVGEALAIDGSGNVYVTGFTDDPGLTSDYATVKYNAIGEELWVAIYNGPGNGNDVPHGIAVDASGNVYVTGQSVGDYATIKYVESGTATPTPTPTPTATATPRPTPTPRGLPTPRTRPTAHPRPRTR